MLDLHSALIYLMVITAASDGEMTDAELHTIGENVRYLPVFGGFDADRLPHVAQECAASLNAEGGFDATWNAIITAIPRPLAETAYALALEVTVADHDPSPAALRILEMARQRLEVQGLSAAALQHAARVRHLA
jgi:tellurite resistance protein